VSVEDFLTRARRHVEAQTPHLLDLFDTMAAEARFARAWLDEDLRRLRPSAPILEVGGGVFLLTCQMADEGFAITAIEPTGMGFGSFEELGAIVLEFAARDGAVPTIARCKVEDFTTDARFALAFSVNVMEHIDSPDQAIKRISAALSPGGSYRFLCPNYLFPYEPHFNIPTVGSKGLTWRLLRGRIEDNAGMDDPVGVWNSLNWITVPQVKRMAGTDQSLVADFRTSTLAWMLERAMNDAEFARRRAGWMVSAVRMLRALHMFRLASLVPAVCQPIMDARLTKRH
jgi:SAM-dependent methyltransferase